MALTGLLEMGQVRCSHLSRICHKCVDVFHKFNSLSVTHTHIHTHTHTHTHTNAHTYNAHIHTGQAIWEDMSVKDFLAGIQLDDLYHDLFQQEHISMDVLVDMTHDDLNSIGITAFGHRHKIIRKVKELVHNGGTESSEPVGLAVAQHTGTQLIELSATDKDFIAVSEEVRRVCAVTCSSRGLS